MLILTKDDSMLNYKWFFVVFQLIVNYFIMSLLVGFVIDNIMVSFDLNKSEEEQKKMFEKEVKEIHHKDAYQKKLTTASSKRVRDPKKNSIDENIEENNK